MSLECVAGLKPTSPAKTVGVSVLESSYGFVIFVTSLLAPQVLEFKQVGQPPALYQFKATLYQKRDAKNANSARDVVTTVEGKVRQMPRLSHNRDGIQLDPGM